jgi:hypothetical protein
MYNAPGIEVIANPANQNQKNGPEGSIMSDENNPYRMSVPGFLFGLKQQSARNLPFETAIRVYAGFCKRRGDTEPVYSPT